MTSQTSEKTAALSPELAALAAEGAALEAATAPAPAPEIGSDGQPVPPPDPVDYMGDARGIIDIAAESLAAFYPSTAPILNDEKRNKIAAAAAPVMEKYGLSVGGFLAKFGPEIGLCFALAQVAIPLANAIRADRAAAAAEARREAGKPEPTGPATPMQPVIDRTDPSSLHNKV
jgi:hypothetical protein